MLEQTLSEKASSKVVKAMLDGESETAQEIHAEEARFRASQSFTRDMDSERKPATLDQDVAVGE